MARTILIIDDEGMILDVMKTILEEMGYQIAGFQNPVEGERQALDNDYDLVIVDLRMPERNGAEITEHILEAKVLIITAYPADPLARRALDAGAKGLLKKPFEVAKIVEFLEA